MTMHIEAGAGSGDMNSPYRKANIYDVPRMFDVRRDSILRLAPSGMSIAQSTEWAGRLTLEAFQQRLDETEFWVAEINDGIVGWIGIRDDEICGLYVDPQHANRGIGSGLLQFAEGIMSRAGVTVARLDASWNAEAFYLRQGYKPLGPRPPDNTRTFVKPLKSSAE
jgi:putative acetyltransferase